MTEDVIISFTADTTKLDTALDQLGKEGKVDPAAFKSIQTAINTTATDTKGLITEFKKVATTATQMGKSVENAFGAGIQDALDEAGVSVKDFSAALTKANAPAKTLKQELRQLVEALAQAKASGKDTGAEFDAMRKRAGQLRDAIDDANKEIKNAGSDTRNLDNVVGSISALAGGFAAAQGAIALFGEEDKNLQKALLKVNGAMALASGLQQFYNATLKEGAITKLADSIATGAQSAAMTLYTFVVTGATVATRVFRAALIATGIGALVVLVVSLVQAIQQLTKETDDGTESIDKFNERLERENKLIDDQIEAIDKRLERQKLLNRIKSTGETLKEADAQSELQAELDKVNTKQGILNKRLAERNKLQEEENKLIQEQAVAQAAFDDASDQVSLSVVTGKLNKVKAKIFSINKEIIADSKASIQQSTEAINTVLGQEGDAAQEVFEKTKKAREKAEAERKAQRLRNLQDELAALERQLLTVVKNSQAEIDIKKSIVAQKAKIDLNAEKLTSNQILLIKEKSLNDQLELQKKFNSILTAAQLQAQIDGNAAILAGISINNEERLRLQIENINTSAQLEVNAAEGNAAKILLIEAKKQADIRALKNKAIDDELADQILSSATTNRIIKNALEAIAANTKNSTAERIAAIHSIATQELLEVDKKIEANKKKEQSEEDYTKRYKELADERSKIIEDEEKRKAEIKKAADESDKQRRIAIAEQTIQIVSKVGDLFAQLSALASEQERQRIDAQKRQLDELEKAGAITKKQADVRRQQIEVAERRAKQKQAEQEKQAAVFKALLAIPSAFLQGLSQGGIYLAAIYAALAAAQAALVISRPVPKFFRGKKGNYQGPAEVGEMGAELVERNGRMFLYTNPTKTYLHAKDKVYTASETRNILHNTNVNTTMPVVKGEKFDYERLAKLMPKSSSVKIDFNSDYVEKAIENGLNKTKHFNTRYKF